MHDAQTLCIGGPESWIGPMHRGAAEFDGMFKIDRRVDIVREILKED